MSSFSVALLICAVVAVPRSHESDTVREAIEERLTTSIPAFDSTASNAASTANEFASTTTGCASTATDFAPTTSESSSAVMNLTTGSTHVVSRSENPEVTTFEMSSYRGDSCISKMDDHVDRINLDPHDYLGKIVIPITFIVGLTGNAATMFALQGHPFNKIPSRYILSSLTVSDSLALVVSSLGKKTVKDVIGEDAGAYDRNSCKIFIFVSHFAKILSSWFVVLVCCERFVAICLPLHAKQICTKSNALVGIVIVVIIAATFSGIWTLSTEKVDSRCNPSYWTPETEVRGKVMIYIGSTLIGLLPMTIMLILTPVMCIVLHRNRHFRKRIATTHNPEVTRISAMLLSVCISYIVLLLPLIISHNLAFIRGENLYTSQHLPLVILAKVGNTLSAINFSCNFFLYVACNAAFRRRMLRACICPQRRETRSPEPIPTRSTVTNSLSDISIFESTSAPNRIIPIANNVNVY
ncbi:FMRFamide receptor-like [Gigantopelta aegis]|uniref:FMRFamide receptor-like n=1 Tax=Gigantopelta aegis TaxID=1735272 RepID=UPI001B887807|nr:FMRFamide receptor-like [Gigantopelta aegis]